MRCARRGYPTCHAALTMSVDRGKADLAIASPDFRV
jgi:hypothetical protein